MLPRVRLSIALAAAWGWLAIALVCGPVWRVAAIEACPATSKSCCEHSAPAKPACAADACSLTCATMLLAQIGEAPFELRPVLTGARMVAEDFRGEVSREPPPVPPPRAA